MRGDSKYEWAIMFLKNILPPAWEEEGSRKKSVRTYNQLLRPHAHIECLYGTFRKCPLFPGKSSSSVSAVFTLGSMDINGLQSSREYVWKNICCLSESGEFQACALCCCSRLLYQSSDQACLSFCGFGWFGLGSTAARHSLGQTLIATW